jgi:lysozyme
MTILGTIRKVATGVVLRRAAATLVISGAGLAGITQYEGTEHTVYLDPVAIPTVCVGHTSTVTAADVGKTYSDEQCALLLKQDTRVAQRAVGRLVKVPVSQGQYDALVSFTFNLGEGNLAKSTLLRKLNAGDCRGAAAEFPRWNKAGGRVLKGLVKRRAWERSIFEVDCP